MIPKAVRFIIRAAALSAAVAWPIAAHASTTEQSQNTPFSPTTSDDLILDREPDVLYNPSGNSEANVTSSPAPGSEGTSANWDTLTDGAAGSFSYSSVVTPSAGTTLTYYLANVNSDPYGVNLTAADVFSAWADSGRSNQNYSILYSTTDNSSVFQTLATVTYNTSNSYEFTSTSQNVNNVARLELVFNSPQENGYVGYQEFIPHGSVAASGTAITPQANVPIQNYNFASPTYTGNYVPIPGWEESGSARTGVNDSTGAFLPAGGQPIPGGSQFAYIQISNGISDSSGALSQKLDDLVIGATYNLTYWIGFRNGNSISTVQAFIDNQAVGNADTPATSGWTEESYDFTYTGTDPAPYLSFLDTNSSTNDETVTLADVQLTNLTVPEPATLSLAALGALALLRRRRRAVA